MEAIRASPPARSTPVMLVMSKDFRGSMNEIDDAHGDGDLQRQALQLEERIEIGDEHRGQQHRQAHRHHEAHAGRRPSADTSPDQ